MELPDPLLREEIDWLFRQLPDRAARERIITHNLRLVRKIVSRYPRDWVDRYDLFSVGVVGLIQAVDAFDPAFGTQFSTLAVRNIQWKISRTLRTGLRRASFQWVSLNESLRPGEENETLESILEDPRGQAELDAVCVRESFEDILERGLSRSAHSKVLRHMVSLRLQGKTQQEVADALLTTQKNVSRWMQTLRREIQMELNG